MKNLGKIITVVCVVFYFLAFTLCCNKSLHDNDLEKKLPASVLERTSVQYVYSPPDENEDIVVTKDTVSFWYVYYTARIDDGDNRYDGYKVIKINTSYFEITKAIFQIVPNYKEKDYVGVQFFKRVPYETYKSYKETDGE